MLGSVVNGIAIVIGGLIGLMLKQGIPTKLKDTIMQGMGLTVILVGLQMAVKSADILVVVLSLAAGAVIGESIGIEDKLERLGRFLEMRLVREGESRFAQGFVTTSLIYCVGAMAIMGALQSGLEGNHSTLFAKAMIDGVTAIVFASTLGFGVLFSSIPVFVYQGAITLLATWINQFLTAAIIVEMSATGGLLIVAIGMNLLGMSRIKVGNLLPAVFVPIVLMRIMAVF